uniref:Uncharacterized protein n=1 Tax=Romanomermis culicivorax TaxID=13658 RepID=A0A915HFR6_ROMCU
MPFKDMGQKKLLNYTKILEFFAKAASEYSLESRTTYKQQFKALHKTGQKYNYVLKIIVLKMEFHLQQTYGQMRQKQCSVACSKSLPKELSENVDFEIEFSFKIERFFDENNNFFLKSSAARPPICKIFCSWGVQT